MELVATNNWNALFEVEVIVVEKWLLNGMGFRNNYYQVIIENGIICKTDRQQSNGH